MDKLNYEKNNLGVEHDPFSIERYKQFYSLLRKNDKIILDVGCNRGIGGVILKQLDPSFELYGLDCNKDYIQKLDPKIYNGSYCVDVTNTKIPSNSIHAIVAGEFIEHLTYDDAHKTIQEFYRLLQKDGIVLLTTPNPNYLKLKITRKSVLGGAHLSQYLPNELKKILSDTGFKEIFIKPSGKVTRFLGSKMPILSLYGSYLIGAVK